MLIGAGGADPAGAEPGAPPPGMVRVDAGTYTPMFDVEGAQEIPAFYLDERPVTNREYLEFVTAVPEWRRSRVPPLFADEGYLAGWVSDLEPGGAPNAPVVTVSWFASRAYCEWVGKRLPTLAEWERTAVASETEPDGRELPAFHQRILDWYGQPTPSTLAEVKSTFRNYWGAWDMHGLVWEWVADFNTALVTGESRGDAGLDRGLFCGSGSVGAADFRDYAAFMRYAFRSSLQGRYTVRNLGFRGARDVVPEEQGGK